MGGDPEAVVGAGRTLPRIGQDLLRKMRQELREASLSLGFAQKNHAWGAGPFLLATSFTDNLDIRRFISPPFLYTFKTAIARYKRGHIEAINGGAKARRGLGL